MPHSTDPVTPRQKRAQKTARIKQLLAGKRPALGRDDSDDELGSEDLPWEWIYEKSQDDILDDEESDAAAADIEGPRKRRRKNAPSHRSRAIIGAKNGTFTCKVGDCVLVKGEGSHSAWVAMIWEFTEDEVEGKSAKLVWFINHEEIHNKKKKRSDYLPNELYLTPEYDENPLTTINGTATVLSEQAFEKRFPNGKVPKRLAEKTFICRRGCHARTATYTDEFDWDSIHHSTEAEIELLFNRIGTETGQRKKRKYQKRIKADDEFTGQAVHDSDLEVETPRKRQKHFNVSTPKKVRTPSKLLTPSHKRVIVKKPLEFTPLGTRVLDPDHVYSSPFQTARSRLHVAAVPSSLPCREVEFESVFGHLSSAIADGSGSCIYISGTPGTGKTATVREVVAQLNASVQEDELEDFIFVEINGMKVTDPHQSYSLLWEALKGDRVSPKHALDLLEREFNYPSPRRIPCVVLMDELDQLVTKNQSVMYNFFNWPQLRHSKLIVLAVANTMDLPERTLSNKISSRLGLTRITFSGYTHDQLMKIIQSRLEGVEGDIVTSDAIQFASRKVAAVSGDARRALDICRRAVEIAETEANTLIAPDTPSKSGNGDKVSGGGREKGKVTIATIKRAISEATTSPLQQYLRSLPLSSKLLLAALVVRMRRTGIAESIMGEVLDEAKRLAKMSTASASQAAFESLLFLLQPANEKMAGKRLAAPRIQGLGSAAVELMEAGVVGLELGMRRAERSGKMRLCVGEDDVKLAFKDDPEVKGLGF